MNTVEVMSFGTLLSAFLWRFFSTYGDDWRAILAGLRWLQINRCFFSINTRYLVVGPLPTKSHAELTISLHLVGSISIFHFIVVNIHSNFKWILYLRYCNEFDRLKRSPSTIVIQDCVGAWCSYSLKEWGSWWELYTMRGQHLNSKPCPTLSLERIVSGFSQWSPSGAWQVGHVLFSHCQGGQRPYIAVINNEVGLTVPGFRCCPLSGGWHGLTGWSLGEIVTGWIRSWPLEAQDLVGMCAISKSAKKDKAFQTPRVFKKQRRGGGEVQTNWRNTDNFWG